MTPSTDPANFGVTAIMGAAFRLLTANFLVLVGVVFLANMGLTLVNKILLSVFNLSSLLFDMLLGPVIAAVTILMTADIIAGRPILLRQHITSVGRLFGPLVVLSLASWFLISLATLALILPGIYVAALMMPLAPVILFEKDPWSALGRSYALSKPYVWPLCGLVLALGLAAVVLLMPLFLAGADFAVVLDENILVTAAVGFLGAILSCYGSIVALLVYYRLTGDQNAADLGSVFR